jgi:hypothetical protein
MSEEARIKARAKIARGPEPTIDNATWFARAEAMRADIDRSMKPQIDDAVAAYRVEVREERWNGVPSSAASG